MTTKRLDKEYFKALQEAAAAPGRRETMELYRKARLIKKKLYAENPEHPLHQQRLET